MTAQTAILAQHATLSTTVQDTVTFSYDGAESLCVTNHDATTKLFFSLNPKEEVQTISFTSYGAGDVVFLTYGGTESANSAAASAAAGVTLGRLQTITDELFTVKIAGYTNGDCVVTQTTLNVEYVWTFSGASVKNTDLTALSVTNGTGSATGSVVETIKGGLVALDDNSYVVLPLQSKVIKYPAGRPVVYIGGNGNIYSAELG